MSWYIWWGIAAGILAVTVIDAIVVRFLRYKRKRVLTPNKTLIIGTFVSATVMLCPMYLDEFSDSVRLVELGKAVLISVQHAIRLFAFDGDYMDIVENVKDLPQLIQTLYTALGAFLYFFAPMLTFGFILSFFKNFSAYCRYALSFRKETHVFSGLSERSLALAGSIDDTYNKTDTKKGGKRRYRLRRRALIVFTDVVVNDDEKNMGLIEDAKEMGAILFTKDLGSIRYRFRRLSKRKVSFYLISDDEEEKLRRAEGVIGDYKDVSDVKLFLFSDSTESKCFLESYTEDEKKNIRLKAVRVNDARSLIYHNLNRKGVGLFEKANLLDDGTREISAVVVGLGKYGTEVVKALLWYCQLPGYRVRITAFDENECAGALFKGMCPAIGLDEEVDAIGDMRYTLSIKTATFGTEAFYSQIENTVAPTYIFVCLGGDELNVTAALGIRDRLAARDRFPEIETVVYNSALKNRVGSSEKANNIKIIGAIEDFYSEGTVINSSLIDDALEAHRRWDGGSDAEKNFYLNDYNYCSSMASALHRNLRKQIISYPEEKNREEVFPFYYSDGNAELLSGYKTDRRTINKILPVMNDNESIKAFSEKMRICADYTYIKLAHLHYGRLDENERAEVIGYIKNGLEDLRNKDAEVRALPDNIGDAEGYEAFIQSVGMERAEKKILRGAFEVIVDLKTRSEKDDTERREIISSLEYSALTERERAEVCEYVRSHIGGSAEEFDIGEYFAYASCFAHIEHVRWIAYMRTEGFQRAHRRDREYNEYKLHYDIVPCDMLTFSDRIKDI